MMNRAIPLFNSSLFLFFLSLQMTLFAFDSPTASLPQEVKAHVIDGKLIATKIQASLKAEVDAMIQKGDPKPVLAIVQIGNNPASTVYVRNKRNACLEVGITPVDHHLPETTTEKELLTLLEKLNADSSVNGILVQLPLPKQINPLKIQNAIKTEKDVDGFNVVNAGKLFTGEPGALVPCTPLGMMAMIESEKIDPSGKIAVVIGRSNIVGKPIADLLLSRDATVIICHSKTPNLPSIVRQGDIVIAAVGRPEFVRGDWIKPGAAVIDVGINRLPNGKLIGDVNFPEAAKVAGFISPVPGGVGPMTIAMLVKNTVQAYRMQKQKI